METLVGMQNGAAIMEINMMAPHRNESRIEYYIIQKSRFWHIPPQTGKSVSDKDQSPHVHFSREQDKGKGAPSVHHGLTE